MWSMMRGEALHFPGSLYWFGSPQLRLPQLRAPDNKDTVAAWSGLGFHVIPDNAAARATFVRLFSP